MSKNKKRNLNIILAILGTTVIAIAVVYVALLYYDINSEDSNFIEAVNNQAISANVLLVVKTENGYSSGHSGVIFKSEDNKYYALTAFHAIGHDATEVLVLRHDQLVYNAYVENNEIVGIIDYYEQFPKAVIEYYDEAYDLAVLSFVSDLDFTVLPIANQPPEYNDSVAAIGNPWENRNYRNATIVTTGRVTSRNPVPFGDKAGKNQHNVIRHSARMDEGNSGGALVNQSMEIVGVNLGGGENIFGWFVFGMAMPSDKILEFLSEADITL
jgi:S1-C subfamily serine protease